MRLLLLPWAGGLLLSVVGEDSRFLRVLRRSLVLPAFAHEMARPVAKIAFLGRGGGWEWRVGGRCRVRAKGGLRGAETGRGGDIMLHEGLDDVVLGERLYDFTLEKRFRPAFL